MPLHLNPIFVRNVIGKYISLNAVVQPNRTQTLYIVAHHAAWTYPLGTACQSIFNFHSSQWPKYGRIGYHEVIQEEPDGSLACYQVNPPGLIGAGVWGMNDVCFHICCATHFRNDIPAQAWQDALALRVAAAKKRYPGAVVVGHREITKPGHGTDCPGGRWAEWKPKLIAAAGDSAELRWALWGDAYPLDRAQRVFSIPQRWYQSGTAEQLGAATSAALYGGGRVFQVFEHGFIWGPAAGGPLDQYRVVLV